MRRFVINDIERFTGVKAHTLRIWERRYGLINPQRNISQIRYYSLNDLIAILNLTLLNKQGLKISKISKLTSLQIEQEVDNLTDSVARKQSIVNQLLRAMFEMDTEEFELILDESFMDWSIQTVVNDIIFPFIEKTELLWQGKGLNEEHFVVTIVRKKLIWSIEKIQFKKKQEFTALLFLSDLKQLDLMLLYVNFILKYNGINVLYMGNDISINNLQSLLIIKKPEFIITYFPKKSGFPIKLLSQSMDQLCPNSQMIIINQDGDKNEMNGYSNVVKCELKKAILHFLK